MTAPNTLAQNSEDAGNILRHLEGPRTRWHQAVVKENSRAGGTQGRQNRKIWASLIKTKLNINMFVLCVRFRGPCFGPWAAAAKPRWLIWTVSLLFALPQSKNCHFCIFGAGIDVLNCFSWLKRFYLEPLVVLLSLLSFPLETPPWLDTGKLE